MDDQATQRAIRRVAENQIRQAIAAGAFDRLPGAGRPFPDTADPYDALWWVRRWVRREHLQPALARGSRAAPAGRRGP